ncbi:branched-chain amino acid transport system II carrier protein [Microvirga sp. W0021]|uniref:Branched-chain amino acid transport system carrier protein n=1 Tax=Hohaiivirga grylli TaxID=3133970 RepID=A0ABV0BJ73_9HYPH
MKDVMKGRDIIALGFMTLSLFVGAGNIIYPPIVGLQAGANVWITAFGFLITAVGLPILTVIALAKVGGEMTALSAPIGKVASTVLAVVCYLSVGPLFAVPRTATVSYEIGVLPFMGEGSGGHSLIIYSTCYFLFTILISLYPTKLLDVLGNLLSPLKILALALLGVAAFLYPAGPVGDIAASYSSMPMAKGFSDGYLTMDTLGALVFGIVIVNAIRSRDITDTRQIIRYASIAGMMAFVGFVLIYISLFKLGNNSYSLAPNAENGAVILHMYVRHTFGVYGDMFLAGLITLACVVTAIGLTTACATYFSQLCHIPYKLMVVILAVCGFMVSNLGLTKIIELSVFALTAIYPPCIALVVLSFILRFFRNASLVFSSVMLTALVFGIFDALKPLKLTGLFWYDTLPLAASGLAWLLPTLLVFVCAVVFDRLVLKPRMI